MSAVSDTTPPTRVIAHHPCSSLVLKRLLQVLSGLIRYVVLWWLWFLLSGWLLGHALAAFFVCFPLWCRGLSLL